VGGARIGFWNATWPFAQLSVTKEQLLLKVGILGTYTFKPDDVTSVEPYGWLPFLGKGVRINHRLSQYPEKIVFWYLCANPKPIAETIHQMGFGSVH
jgi:hypothetical protein